MDREIGREAGIMRGRESGERDKRRTQNKIQQERRRWIDGERWRERVRERE